MMEPQMDTSYILLGIFIVPVAAEPEEVWARRLGLPQVLG